MFTEGLMTEFECVRYRVIWNRVQLFGDYNTRVRVAHECVIITKKAARDSI